MGVYRVYGRFGCGLRLECRWRGEMACGGRGGVGGVGGVGLTETELACIPYVQTVLRTNSVYCSLSCWEEITQIHFWQRIAVKKRNLDYL